MTSIQRPENNTKRRFSLLLLVAMTTVILSALAFEHIGGYQPCKLCLEQRWPWYIGIPIMAITTVFVFMNLPENLTRVLTGIVGIILLYSMYLGIRHAGVEWGFWEGPGDCGAVDGGLATNTIDLLKQLEETVAPSCTDAALRVLGLSFAGWNAVVSLLLAGFAFRLATRRS